MLAYLNAAMIFRELSVEATLLTSGQTAGL